MDLQPEMSKEKNISSYPGIHREPTKSIIKLHISKEGGIDFEGDLNPETANTLADALDRATYYKQKTDNLANRQIDLGITSDVATLIFGGIFTIVLTFGVVVIANTISNSFNTGVTENVR